MLRYLGQLGQLVQLFVEISSIRMIHRSTRLLTIDCENEILINSNRDYQSINIRNREIHIISNTRNFSSIHRTLEFSKIRGSDFRTLVSKKEEINGYVRIISIRIVLIVLSFTRGEHVREKNRDISRLAGVNKVVCNHVRYLRIPPMPGQLSVVTLRCNVRCCNEDETMLRRRWQRA